MFGAFAFKYETEYVMKTLILLRRNLISFDATCYLTAIQFLIQCLTAKGFG